MKRRDLIRELEKMGCVFIRKNVYDLTWEKISAEESDLSVDLARRRTIYMLPFLPSLGIQVWI